MICRFRLLTLSCLVTLCFTSPAAAELLFVGRGAIEFKQGPGLCHVNPDWSKAERLVVDSQRRANAGLNDVVAVFAPCAEVESLRGGKRVTSPQAEKQYRALEKYSRDLTQMARRSKTPTALP